MEVKVNIIDTLFTTIPKNTVVASYTIDEDSVDLTMLNDQYSFNTTNKTILTSSNVTSNNLKAINFTARNWVSGEQVEINDMYPRVVSKLQNKFNKPNTIYKVTKDLDLNHRVLTIPEGCTLQFDGGSISNGTIDFNNTLLKGRVNINCNIITGSIKNQQIYVNWFNVDNTGISEDTALINYILQTAVNKTVIFDGIYKIDPIASSSKEYDGGIRPVSNQTLKFTNGSKLIIDKQSALYFSILSIYRVENVSIYGANIEGDINTHSTNQGEYGFGVAISSSKNINLYNCKSSYNWGDGYIFLSTGSEESNNFDCNLYNCEAHYNRRQGLSIVALYGGRIDNFKATNTGILKYTAPAAGIDIEPDAIRYDERIKVVINNYTSENNFGGALHIVPAHLMHDNVTDGHREFYVQVNGLSSNLDGSRDTSVLLPALRYSSVTTNSNLQNKIKGLVELSNITISNSYMNPLEFRNMVDNGLPIVINSLTVLNPKVDSSFAKSMSAVLKFYNPTTYDYTNSTELTINGIKVTDTRTDNRVSYLMFSTFGNSPKNIHLFNVDNPSMEGGSNIPYFIDDSSEVYYSVSPVYTVNNDDNFLLSNNSNNYWGYKIIFNNPSVKSFRLPKGSTVSNFEITVENIQQENVVHSRFIPGDKINESLVYNQDPSFELLPNSSIKFIQRKDKSWDVKKSTDDIIPTLNPYYGNSKQAIAQYSNPILGHSYYDINLDTTLNYGSNGWQNPDGTDINKVIFASRITSFIASKTIYKIIFDIDLGGTTLTLPANCTLDFQGGSFSNGTVIGSNTTILPNGYKIQNVSLKGSFKYSDGVNAISSDGLCLNNVYDILDKQNLATTEVNNYVVKDDDYTILSQFDTIKNVNAVDGSFIGFPTSVIYNNLLYCFYYKANTHESTPGIQENIYYKYSSDKGITWSEEKEWALPASDSNGTYRSYRTAYVVPFGSNLLFGIFCTTTTSSAIGGSFTLVCEATISEAHDITILNQIKTPIVGTSGSLVYNYTDATITNSMIIGGNIIQVGSNYLMACYTSNRNNYIFSFDGNFTDNTHITQLDVISSEQFDYTEHAFIKFSDTNFYIAFREDARRENTPIFKYNTSTSKFELFTYIDNVAYDGLDAIILDDNTAMIAGRDARNYFTPTRFALMNSSGKVFISNAKYYGEVLGRDCGYCSLQIIEDTLINIFYLKRSQPNYNYGVVSRRIPVKTLTNLIFY